MEDRGDLVRALWELFDAVGEITSAPKEVWQAYFKVADLKRKLDLDTVNAYLEFSRVSMQMYEKAIAASLKGKHLTTDHTHEEVIGGRNAPQEY